MYNTHVIDLTNIIETLNMANIIESEVHDKLCDKLCESYQKVIINAVYYHYKKPLLQYQVIDLGLDEASEEPVVIYKALYGKSLIWVSRVDSWCDQLEYEGKVVSRFNLVKSG